LTLQEIEEEITRLAQLIKADLKKLPTFGHSIDMAHPHIEVNNSKMYLIFTERGQEIKRITTTDFHKLLYWVFEGITFDLAVQYELLNRDPSKDCRRIIFKKQQELLNKIKPEWKTIIEQTHLEILENYPFDDPKTAL
jgi:LPS sulfotransferase NodH